MGAALFKSFFPNQKPYVALLNIGSRKLKVQKYLKKAYSKLKVLNNENNFTFNGYIEGNKLMHGNQTLLLQMDLQATLL